MAKAQGFTPSVFDRLIAPPGGACVAHALEQLKDAVARDLEDLLNTRTAFASETGAASLINYGLPDFAGLCLTSDEDRKQICAAVLCAIQSHEPRLSGVSACLRVKPGAASRVDIAIVGMLTVASRSEPVCFNALLQGATQRYRVSKAGGET